ncbi:BUD23 [Lepeophtheirus salmonis]|uniref:BUD23 n=1 Tax=Lepeophtheirus salmonis TaxID=72036 RepID=A0A7R8H103_LEPSM|nr:BUD23 [Lepeophtheirus salmonis]CAF2779350.1 BUD23 [Lepeophtheirus salmonis]
MSSVRRPEHKAPPDVFYNEDEAQKYTTNTRMMQIQNDMTERAMELLNLPPDVPCFILDLGCGSGLSGEVLEENGHFWIGMDISSAMLNVAREREWLCNADKSYHHPQKRLYTFFSSLYSSLSCGARAIFQFYPENNQQIEMITNASMRAGFTGVLMTGGNSFLPKALGEEDEESQTVKHEKKRERMKRLRNGKSVKKSRDWILEKKERRRRQGRDTRPDTKFTGRKRSGHL